MTPVVLDVPFDALVLSQKRKAHRATYRFGAVGFALLTVFLLAATIGFLVSVWSVPAMALVVGLVMAALLLISASGFVIGVRGDGRPADWAEPWAVPPVAIRVTAQGLWLAGGDALVGTTVSWENLHGLRIWTGARGVTCLTVTPGLTCTLGVSEPQEALCRLARLTGSQGIEVLPETLAVPLAELDRAVQSASGGRHRLVAR